MQRERQRSVDSLLGRDPLRVDFTSLVEMGDRTPPAPRRRRLNRAVAITAALMVGGVGTWWASGPDASGWWNLPGQDTAPSPGNVCSAPTAPTVTAVPNDTGTTALGSAFQQNCSSGSDTHASSDWWVTGPVPSASADTVVGQFASDSLERYTDLATTLLTDSTYVLHGRYTGAVGGVSAEGVDTFVAAASVASILFASSWLTATGNGIAAIADSTATQPWTRYDAAGFCTVVADPFDFPTANVVECNNGDGGYVGIAADDGVIADTVAAGSVRGWRQYFRYTNAQAPPITDNDTHGFTVGAPALSAIPSTAFTGGDFNVEPFTHELEADGAGFFYRIRTPFGINGNFSDWFYATEIPADTTLVFESWVAMLSDTTFTLHARIMQIDGTVVADDADFCSWWLTCSDPARLTDSTALVAPNGALEFNTAWVGLNGYSGGAGELLYYFGSWAMCSGGPCGLYTPGEAGN